MSASRAIIACRQTTRGSLPEQSSLCAFRKFEMTLVDQVNATWFAPLVANIEALYACDDGELHSNATHTRFVLSNLDSDDFLYAIGLRNGDTVQTINRITINAFSAGYTAYALHLNGTTSYTVSVKRGGSAITLSISLV